MRRVSIIAALVLAVALGATADDALAQRIATSAMVARPDFAQFQAAVVEWLRATVISGPFVFGAAIGVVLAEGGRFLWRWSMRTLGIVNTTFGFVLRHRLIVAGLAAGLYYAAIYTVFI